MNQNYYYDYEGVSASFLPNIGVPDAPVHDGETRRQYATVGLSVMILTFATIAGQVVFTMVCSAISKEFLSSPWFQWLASFVPLYGIALPLMWLLLRRVEPCKPEKQRFGAGHWLIFYVIATGCMMLGSIIGNGLMSFLNGLTGNDVGNGLESTLNAAPLWQTFLFTVIAAPIGEEFIFRKLLVDRMRRFGELPAVLLSGLLFGLFHGNFYQFFYTFMLGVLLAYLYVRSGKIHLCMMMHALVNLVGGVLTTWITDHLDTDLLNSLPAAERMTYIGEHLLPYLSLMLYNVWMFGCLIAGIALVIVRRKKTKLLPAVVPVSRQSLWKDGIFSWGMILAYCACGLLFVISLSA